MLSMLSSNRRSSSGLYCEMGFNGGFFSNYTSFCSPSPTSS